MTLYEEELSQDGKPLYWIYVTKPRGNGITDFEGDVFSDEAEAVKYKRELREKYNL